MAQCTHMMPDGYGVQLMDEVALERTDSPSLHIRQPHPIPLATHHYGRVLLGHCRWNALSGRGNRVDRDGACGPVKDGRVMGMWSCEDL